MSQVANYTQKTKPELSAEQKTERRLRREALLRLLTVDRLSTLSGLPEQIFEIGGDPICCPWHDDSNPSCSAFVGDDDYPLWWCHAEHHMRTALDVVALSLGTSLETSFRQIWDRAVELVGGNAALDGLALTEGDLRHARRSGEPVKRIDLGSLLVSPRPVTCDDGASSSLERWGLSPAFVADHGLAYASPGRYCAPHWQLTPRGAWVDNGYALMVPQIDPTGRRVTVRTRRTQERWDGKKPPKTKAPRGASCDEAISVNGPAWRLFVPRLDDGSRAILTWLLPEWPTDEAPLPTVVEIAEGEKDWLLRCEVAQPNVAVIGIQAGSWCQEFADRIPDGTLVRLCTHSDEAGIGYQHYVAKSLRGRCPIEVRHQRVCLANRWIDGDWVTGTKQFDEVELHHELGREVYLTLPWLPYMPPEPKPAPPPPTVHEYTDLGNAKRLVDRHGKDIRFCAAWDKWLIWDGTRWAPDEVRRIDLLAADTVESILGEPVRLPPPTDAAAGELPPEPATCPADEIVAAKAELARLAAAKAEAAKAAVVAAGDDAAARLKAETAAAAAADRAAAARVAAAKAVAKYGSTSGSGGSHMSRDAWAYDSQNSKHLGQLERIARSRVPVRPAQLDADQWLLNTRSGVVDLRTGDIRGAARELMQTKIADAELNLRTPLEAQCPVWLRFLREAMNGNERLVDFLRRAVGYSITGSAKEQKLFVLLGPGGSGKGTFVNTLQKVLGEYARSSPRSLVADRSPDAHPTDIAGLAGYRFVVVSELKKGSHLATDTVKLITSEDTVAARGMRENYRDQTVTHKLWVMSQYMPKVDADDSGIWRRVLAIPFDTPPDNVDKGLAGKLKEEWPGILAWAVVGCLEWQRFGLNPPEEVYAKTAEIRATDDDLGNFLDEKCDISRGLEVDKDTLYLAYVAWCARSRVKPDAKNEFGASLALRGTKSRKSGPTRYWVGLDIKPEPVKPASPDARSGLLDLLPTLN